MRTGADRRARLTRAHLYLVADLGMPLEMIDAALAGGVDMVQLRDRDASREEIVAAAAGVRALCDEHDALLWINDDPDLALDVGADGVHVGQDDEPVTAVRARVGPEVLIGLSTHSPEQLVAAAESEADQLSVGPVWETPTKPGRAAAGIDYVRAATERDPRQPWFAIGGIDVDNVREVVAAGATRAVVVRALRESQAPRATARHLRASLTGGDRVGAAQ